MVVNRDEFIREMTLRVCSSLDIKAALERVFEYLKEHFPLDTLDFSLIDTRLGAIRRLAYVTAAKLDIRYEIVPLPEGILEAIQSRPYREAFVVSPENDELMAQIAPLFNLEGNSDLILPLRVDDRPIGSLGLRAAGTGRYTTQHAELLSCVSHPFSIALANALAHEAVLRYRDVLIDDKRFLNRELHLQAAEDVIGSGSGLRHVAEMVQQVAPLNNTVLLLGETGTGKELIANMIHFSSPRKDGPFIKVNCGAIPESLMDSELFGHVRGAFSGAVTESRGRFERADGGTIFLDEIGELPLSAQTRLLRVLQERVVERVGGGKGIPVNIRVIAATHRDLKRMIEQHLFREDLWFRLNGYPIVIPPLRERREDVPALIRHFVAQKSRELGRGLPPAIAPGALHRLVDYPWPGNVRELENVVERELIRHRSGQLTFESVFPQPEPAREVAGEGPREFRPRTLDAAMAEYIGQVLAHTNGKIHGPGGAAEILGMNPNTLRWRIDKLGIRYERKKNS